MLQNTGHVMTRIFTQANRILLVNECIFFAFEQGLVTMHTRSAYTVQWLRHKSCMQAMMTSDCFNDQFESLNLVSRFNCFRIFKIDFVLTRSYFMMGCFNFKAHFFQFQHNFTAAIFTKICRCKVKVTTLVI
ncbi:hypothetical protein D3C78_1179010 [compost metagenome]